MIAFDFSQDHTLENDRVRLRPLVADDFQQLRHFVHPDRDIWHYSLIPLASETDLQLYIQAAIDSKTEHKHYAFSVFDKQHQQYAGCTRFYDIDLHHKTLLIGYTWYGTAFQGTGLNKNCKYLLLQFAFEQLKMERVEFRLDERNQRSLRALERIGCHKEGVLRSHLLLPNGIRRSSIVMSILAEEWYSGLAARLLAQAQTPASPAH